MDVRNDGSVLSGLNSLVVVAAAPTNPVETERVSATMDEFATFAREQVAETMHQRADVYQMDLTVDCRGSDLRWNFLNQRGRCRLVGVSVRRRKS